MARRFTICAMALSLVIGVNTATALADEFCVACQGPEASYRCITEASGQLQSLKLACISELARVGNHESCSIRSGKTADCAGPVRHVGAEIQPGLEEARAATAAAPGAIPPEERLASKPVAPIQSVTATIVNAAKSAGDGVANAGRAINDGAKKTWNCLTSMFKGC